MSIWVAKHTVFIIFRKEYKGPKSKILIIGLLKSLVLVPAFQAYSVMCLKSIPSEYLFVQYRVSYSYIIYIFCTFIHWNFPDRTGLWLLSLKYSTSKNRVWLITFLGGDWAKIKELQWFSKQCGVIWQVLVKQVFLENLRNIEGYRQQKATAISRQSVRVIIVSRELFISNYLF